MKQINDYRLKVIVGLFLAFTGFTGVLAQAPLVSIDSTRTWNDQVVKNSGSQVFTSSQIITGFELDSTNQVIYFKLRNDRSRRPPGHLVAFDLQKKVVLWEIPFNPEKDKFFLVDTLPVTKIGGHSRAHNRMDGQVLWIINLEIEAILPNKMLGLGMYAHPSRNIVGIDLITSKVKWEYQAHDMSTLETISFYGDTSMIITAKGIHHVNLDSGKGFSHIATTEFVNSSGMAFAAGMLGGLIGALIFVSIDQATAPASYKMVGNEQKPYNLYNGIINYTSTKSVLAFDAEGNVIWERPVPKGLVGLSKMFIVNDALYVINNGVLHTPEISYYGDIWLSKWEMETGEVLRSKMIGNQKEEFIKDYIIRDSTILLALNNGMAEYTLKDFTLVKENIFGSATKVSGLKDIIASEAFLKIDGKLEGQNNAAPGYIFIENSNGMKIGISPELEMKSVVKKSDFYTVKNNSGLYLLLENGSETLLTDTAGTPMSTISFTSHAQIMNDLLIDFHENSMLLFPLFAP